QDETESAWKCDADGCGDYGVAGFGRSRSSTGCGRRECGSEAEGGGAEAVGGGQSAEAAQISVDGSATAHSEGRDQAAAAIPVPVRAGRQGGEVSDGAARAAVGWTVEAEDDREEEGGNAGL